MVRRYNLKQDLSSRFELLVQQEIKNYNDAKLATNVSLNEFRQKLNALSDKYDKQFTSFSNIVNRLESEKIDLKIQVKELSRKHEKQTNDFKLSKDLMSFDSKNKNDEFANIKEEIYLIKSILCKFDRTYIDEINSLKQCVKDLYSEINSCYQKSLRNDLKLKQEILSIPSEAHDVKCEMQREIQSNKIDVDGVNENINLFRDEFEYEKKKIESIFNRIKRLEKRVES